VQVGLLLLLMLIALYPFFGPRLPSALLMFLGAWIAWRERRALFAVAAQRRWAIVFLLMFVPVLLSVPGSLSLRHSAGIALALALYFFAGVAVIHSLRADPDRRWLAKWIGVVMAFWVVDSAIQYVVGKDLFGVPLTTDGRVIGPFAASLAQPILLVHFTPLLAWLLLPVNAALAALAFVVTSVVSMLTGVRTALVWIGVSAAGLFMRLPRWRWKWPAAGLAVVLLALAVGLSPALQKRLPTVAQLQNPSVESIDRILSYRLTIWHTAGNMVRDRPLTGVGAGAFQSAYDRYSTRPDDVFRGGGTRAYHAHQLYVGITAETGLIGLIGLIAVIVLCIRWYWQAPAARRDQAWPFALGLVIYAFPINSQSVLYSHRMFPLLLLLLGGMLAALDRPPADDAPGKQV
jgi:O-antigen ligase